MNAIPKCICAQDVDPSRRYGCPLCKVQTTSDEADIGWVLCPMIRNAPICLGCCLDHQKVARSNDFDGHPFRGLFDDVSQLTGNSVSALRELCLEHQEAIVHAKLAVFLDEQTRQALVRLLSQIRMARGKY